MKTPIYCMVVTAALGVAATARAEGSASCVIKITSSPEILLVNDAIVNALLESRGGAMAAALESPELRKLMQEEESNVGDLASWGFEPLHEPGALPAGQLIGRLSVTVDGRIADAQALADRILVTACERLRADLVAASNDARQQLATVLAAADSELREAKDLDTQLRGQANALCAQAGVPELARDEVAHTVRKLIEQQQQLELDGQASEAERAAIAEQIARVAQELEVKSAQDPVAAELAKVVELREKYLQTVQKMVESHAADEKERWTAQEAVAHARAELAARREAVGGASGGNQLTELNARLTHQAIQCDEMKARLTQVRALLADMEKRRVVALATEYENDLALQLGATRERIMRATRQVHELSEQQRMFQPATLIVLGGLPGEKTAGTKP